MEKITVVIPNYNGIKYLNDCLDSLYKQEPDTPEYQVLVVDNGSADDSVKVAREAFPDTRFIQLEENTGFCHAVNVGILESKSEYVLLLNNDTKVKSGFIKALYDAIVSDENIFSVSAQMLMWDKPELIDDAGDRYSVLGWSYSRGKGKLAVNYEKACDVFSACGGAVIYRRVLLDKVGLFDEAHFAYLEDLDIGYRAKILGYRNCYTPEAKVLHYGSASTGSRYNEKKTVLAASNNMYVIYKNMPLLQLILNLPFILLGIFIKFVFFCKKGMGRLYLKGIGQGIKRSFSKEGRQKKVRFQWRNLRNYLRIQWELYIGTIQILKKS